MKYLFIFLLVFIISPLCAQQTRYNGKVVYWEGTKKEPLIGLVVSIIGHPLIMTSTGIDGGFEFTLPDSIPAFVKFAPFDCFTPTNMTVHLRKNVENEILALVKRRRVNKQNRQTLKIWKSYGLDPKQFF